MHNLTKLMPFQKSVMNVHRAVPGKHGVLLCTGFSKAKYSDFTHFSVERGPPSSVRTEGQVRSKHDRSRIAEPFEERTWTLRWVASAPAEQHARKTSDVL
jgi:hypothetical protein